MGTDLQLHEDLLQLMMTQRLKQEKAELISCNTKTEKFGLSLTEAEAAELLEYRNKSMQTFQRIEFSASALPKLIEVFCDSDYINQRDYLEILEKLQEIFYEFKQEAEDLLTDDELLTFMKEQYETVCYGDCEYLESTCLERFAEAVRSGYRGYWASGGKGEYEQLSQEMRWDKDLYLEVLRELFWR